MAPEAPLTKDELVAKAKIAFKTNVANARIAATTPNSRDIDLSKLFPDWDRNTVIQNARRDNILGVVLKQTDREYWEIDFLFVNDRPAQLIKRFTRKDRCLTLYDGLGRFIQKGVYDSKSKTMQLFLTRSQLSSRARISADSTANGEANGGSGDCVCSMEYNGPAGAGGAEASNSDQEWVKPENCNCDCCNSNNEGGGGDNSTGYETGKEPGEGGIEMGGGEESPGGEGGNVYASANESEVPIRPVYNVYKGGSQGVGDSSNSNDYNLYPIENNPCYSDDVKSIIKGAKNYV
jgi:hypothetical protein